MQTCLGEPKYHSIPQYTTVPRATRTSGPHHLTVRLLDDVSVGIPFDAVLIARFRIQHDEFVSLPSEGANESLSAKEIGQKLGKNYQTLGDGHMAKAKPNMLTCFK